jgi:hypothetical protein
MTPNLIVHKVFLKLLLDWPLMSTYLERLEATSKEQPDDDYVEIPGGKECLARLEAEDTACAEGLEDELENLKMPGATGLRV